MHQMNGAVTKFGNSAPLLDDSIHGAVVVFGNLMAAHEGINDQDVDLMLDDFGHQIVYHWLEDGKPAAA